MDAITDAQLRWYSETDGTRVLAAQMQAWLCDPVKAAKYSRRSSRTWLARARRPSGAAHARAGYREAIRTWLGNERHTQEGRAG